MPRAHPAASRPRPAARKKSGNTPGDPAGRIRASTREAPNFNHQKGSAHGLELGSWSFSGAWMLMLEAFDIQLIPVKTSRNLFFHSVIGYRDDCIHAIAFSASRSKAVTHNSRCSSFVSSILLWLMPCRLWTNIITVGTPARATSAASCNGPLGRRCDLPQVSRMD